MFMWLITPYLATTIVIAVSQDEDDLLEYEREAEADEGDVLEHDGQHDRDDVRVDVLLVLAGQPALVIEKVPSEGS